MTITMNMTFFQYLNKQFTRQSVESNTSFHNKNEPTPLFHPFHNLTKPKTFNQTYYSIFITITITITATQIVFYKTLDSLIFCIRNLVLSFFEAYLKHIGPRITSISQEYIGGTTHLKKSTSSTLHSSYPTISS